MSFKVLLSLLLIINCTWISFQDFKERKVSVISLLLFSLLVTSTSFVLQYWQQAVLNAGVSIGILTIQAIILFLYFFIRNKKNADALPFLSLIGGADIWVMITMCFAFSWHFFLFFITVASVTTLLLHLLSATLNKNHNEQIPLAGHFAWMYAILLSLSLFFHFSLY